MIRESSAPGGHKPGQHQIDQRANKAQLRQLAFDGFIGGNGDENDSDYNDLSGELISIEDTYKEVSLYKKSGASNDAMRSSGNGHNPSGSNSAGAFATAASVHGQNYEELK